MTTTLWLLAVYAAGIVGFVMGMVVAALLAGNRCRESRRDEL